MAADLRLLVSRALAAVTLLMATVCATAGKPHEHGVVRLDVSVDGSLLRLDLSAPLDNWLGFERSPRNDAERKAAADVLTRLRNPTQTPPLFSADAAAQCRLVKAEVSAPALEGAGGATAKHASDEHADLEASFEFACAQPAQLRTLDVGLFDAYRRIQLIRVQLATAKAQAKVTLKRPARSVSLTP